jgi:hypothetical protein
MHRQVSKVVTSSHRKQQSLDVRSKLQQVKTKFRCDGGDKLSVAHRSDGNDATARWLHQDEATLCVSGRHFARLLKVFERNAK